MSDANKNTVYVKDASLTVMTNANTGNSSAQIKTKKTGAVAWGSTVLWLHGKKPLDSYDTTQDVATISEAVKKTFKNHFVIDRDALVKAGEAEEIIEGVTEGKNAKTGKMVKIADKNGIKFASWEQTCLSMIYTSEIAHVIKAGMVEDLVLSDKKVAGKNEIVKAAKLITKPPQGASDGKGEGEESEGSATTPEAEALTGLDAIIAALGIIKQESKGLTDDEKATAEDMVLTLYDAIVEPKVAEAV